MPRVGEPRIHHGPQVPVLYPGERATARYDLRAIHAALDRGETELPVTDWLVEPMSGWYGRWLRLRYRVWGRWWETREKE